MQTQNPLTQKPQLSGWFSAPVIILFWILFFPIGIFLTYKRGSMDKKASITIGKVLIGFGVFWSIGAIGDFTSPGDSSYTLTIFTLCHFALGIYNIRRGKTYLRYISLIGEQNFRSIEDIASQVGATFNASQKIIRNLLHAGYFRGYYINEVTGYVEAPFDRQNTGNQREAEKKYDEPLFAVNCKSCGAPQNVKRGSSKCEYCGSTIQI